LQEVYPETEGTYRILKAIAVNSTAIVVVDLDFRAKHEDSQ
jgi:hypothetical protein